MSPATLLFAAAAIGLWSFFATISSHLTGLPPFFVVGIALCIGGLIGGLFGIRSWRAPVKTLAVGVAGMFIYHFLLFTAYQYAPIVEANLINYLWPLLIVLLSPLFLRGYRLKGQHVAGGVISLIGAGLIVTGGKIHPDLTRLPGYLMAGGAALTWSVYSLMTKRLPPFPTSAVGAFCLTAGALSLGLFSLGGQTGALLKSLGPREWFFLLLLGAGPLGLAFFAWDAALKRGDPRLIGSFAYLTPLASTLLLVGLVGKPLSWVSAAAMLLIVAGAVLGSIEMILPGKASPD